MLLNREAGTFIADEVLTTRGERWGLSCRQEQRICLRHLDAKGAHAIIPGPPACRPDTASNYLTSNRHNLIMYSAAPAISVAVRDGDNSGRQQAPTSFFC